jgi:SAM-dependent methyltransferase
MNQLNICPLCGSTSLDHFLQRRGFPVHQNLLMRSQSEALQIERGDLNMLVCNECGFVFNNSFDLSKLAYGENYDNTQSHSPYFERYLEELVHHLIWEKQVCNSRIVEVGCGKGTFLKMLVSSKEVNNVGYGFDPSFVGPLSDGEGRLQFEQRYYGPACTDIAADVVICRHVIEHVPSPLDLLRDVRKALINSPQARVFFETPCVEWILRNQVIWDFFYEHCSLFSTHSLTTAFELAGFTVEKVQHIFNGQYLWLEASLSNQPLAITKKADQLPPLAKQFALSEHDLKTVWKQKIQTLSATGKIAVWGAGAKGITFVNLMDPLGTLIECIVDLNPNKQGCYSPGTGHPIVDFQELESRGVTHVILMNPNYQNENTDLLRQANINIEWVAE